MGVVLIPLDSSKNSEYCLDFYLKYLHREGNQVFTCYVADYYGDIGVMEGPTPGRIQELIEEDKKTASQVEAAVNQIFKASSVAGSFTRLKGKEAWHEIIKYSKSIKANMIVMGSRGIGTIRRTILGSVSESVLHHSEVPVMICKHPKAPQAAH